jgi:hypothetical protein
MSVSGNDGRQREAHSPMGILGLVAGGQYAFLLIRALGFPVTYLITAAPPRASDDHRPGSTLGRQRTPVNDPVIGH